LGTVLQNRPQFLSLMTGGLRICQAGGKLRSVKGMDGPDKAYCVPMTRRRRTVTAFLAAFAFVFAQGAVSVHACPVEQAPVSSEVVAHHEGCHEMPAPDQAPVNGNVCQEHCLYGSVSVDNAPDVAAVDPAGPVLRVDLPEAIAADDSRPAWRPAPAAAPPPAAILFGVLRI